MDKVEACFDKCLVLDSTCPDALMHKARVSWKKGRRGLGRRERGRRERRVDLGEGGREEGRVVTKEHFHFALPGWLGSFQ